MSELYRLRIDAVSGLDVDALLEVCGSVQHVCVRHELPTGNPHYHLFIKTLIKQANLRKKIKTYLPHLLKSDYSIKTCDESRQHEYIQYMFNTKHNNKWELITTLNFDDNFINTLIQNAKQISTDFANTKQLKKNTGPTIWDLAEEMNTMVTVKNKFNVNDLGTEALEEYYNNLEISLEQYIDAAISVCRKHHKAFDEFMLRKLVSTARSATRHGREAIKSRILNYYLN